MKPSRNLWPLAIIATFAIFVAGTGALIVVACRNPADLVSQNYYEDEVRFQSHLEKLDRTRRLSAAGVNYDRVLQRITVTLPMTHAANQTGGQVQFFRPSSSGMDRTYKLDPDKNGVQSFDATDLRPGLWKVKVSWTADGAEYLVDEKLVIQGKET